nr:LTP1 [Colobanthus quitensis]
MASQFQKMLLVVVLLGIMIDPREVMGATSLTAECSTAIQQVTSCLSYATGKATEPTKDCCTAVGSMKDKQPVCLCFFIGQAHNGSQEIKSLGIQEPKLMQLPSACHLANASIAECPKLLGISPSSPAAAIFMHNTTTSPTVGATSLPSSSSTATPAAAGATNSSKFNHDLSFLGGLVLALFIFAF